MAKSEKRSRDSAVPGSPQSTKNEHDRHPRISKLIEQLYSGNLLQLFAGCSQTGLGLTVVFVTVLGFVQPLWLSTLLNIMGSVAAVTGFYMCYRALATWDEDTLLRDAMRRIVEDQN